MSDQRAWQVVLGRIESDLASGALKPGDHLAPERALAAELGVGRSSVREAVRVLEVLGLLRTQTGSGPTSGAVITAAPSDGMSVLMRLQVAAQGFPVTDVVRTRLLLETAVIGELALAEIPDLTEADALLDAMDDDAHSSAEFLALDAQFHLALAARGRQPGRARHHGRAAHLDRGLCPDRRRSAGCLVAGRCPAARRAPGDRGVRPRP